MNDFDNINDGDSLLKLVFLCKKIETIFCHYYKFFFYLISRVDSTNQIWIPFRSSVNFLESIDDSKNIWLSPNFQMIIGISFDLLRLDCIGFMSLQYISYHHRWLFIPLKWTIIIFYLVLLCFLLFLECLVSLQTQISCGGFWFFIKNIS